MSDRRFAWADSSTVISMGLESGCMDKNCYPHAQTKLGKKQIVSGVKSSIKLDFFYLPLSSICVFCLEDDHNLEQKRYCSKKYTNTDPFFFCKGTPISRSG